MKLKNVYLEPQSDQPDPLAFTTFKVNAAYRELQNKENRKILNYSCNLTVEGKQDIHGG